MPSVGPECFDYFENIQNMLKRWREQTAECRKPLREKSRKLLLCRNPMRFALVGFLRHFVLMPEVNFDSVMFSWVIPELPKQEKT